MPKVEVDWKKCKGDRICMDICPVNVFEIRDISEYPDTPKSVPVRAKDCILCMVCVVNCPTNATTVSE